MMGPMMMNMNQAMMGMNPNMMSMLMGNMQNQSFDPTKVQLPFPNMMPFGFPPFNPGMNFANPEINVGPQQVVDLPPQPAVPVNYV